MYWKKMSIGIMLLLISGLTLFSAEIKIENGNLEKVAATGRPVDWIPLDYGWNVEKAGNFFIVTTDAHSGHGAGLIILNNHEKGWSATSITGLKPNSWYKLSLWIKGDLTNLSGKGGTVFILRHLPGKNRIGNAPDKFLGSLALNGAPSEWTRIELPFKTGENTDHMFVAVGLYDALGNLFFDDLKIEEIDENAANSIKSLNADKFADKSHENAVDNLIINGSFEIMTAPYMADGWTHAMHYAGYKRDFYDAIKVVEDNPFHGKRCLKLQNGELCYVGAKVTENEPLKESSVVSFYLRSDETNAVFKVFDKSFKPTKKWQRYSLNLPAGKKAHFWIKAKGTVYVDAFKMELGTKPTAYSDNFRNSILIAPQPIAVKSPVIELKQKITIDSLQQKNGKKSTKPTSCVITKASNSLKFRFECYGRPPEKLVAEIKERDAYLFTDDSVAVTINPGTANGESKPFIFEVNTLGVQRDAYGFNATWDANWKSVVGKMKEGYWVEITIPFAVLNDAFASSTWKINLIRHSAATQAEGREVSAWFNPAIGQIENNGVEVTGFPAIDSITITAAPEVKLANYARSAPTKRYKVEYPIAFSDNKTRQGTATLNVNNKTIGLIKWKAENGAATLQFGNYTADELADIKNSFIIIKEGGKVVAEAFFPERLSAPQELNVGPLNRSYYTSEKSAELKVTVNLAAQLATEFQLETELLGAVKCLAMKRYPAESGIIKFDLPKLKPGVYTLRVSLTRGNGGAAILVTDKAVLNVLAPAKIESKINPITRMMVVNGKSYINHGLSVSAQSRKLKPMQKRMTYLIPDIKEIAKRFNGISPLYATLDGDREQTVPLLKQLVEKFYAAGLDVTMAIPRINTSKSFDPGANFLKNHFDALKEYKLKDWPVIAWYQFDEAYGWWEKNTDNKESDLLDFYWKLKAYDPYRLFYTDTCHCGRIYGGVHHADWIGGSYYPIGLYPPANVVAGVRGAAMATEKTRAKTDARIITGGFLPCFAWERGREPSPAEYKACAYVMLAQGCRTMNLWMYSVLSKQLWDSMIPLKKELNYLSPIFDNGINLSSQVTGSNPAIDYLVYRHEGAVYIMAVNYTAKPQVGAFDTRLTGHFSKIEKVLGNSEPKLLNGIVTDKFEPYACRIFKLK